MGLKTIMLPPLESILPPKSFNSKIIDLNCKFGTLLDNNDLRLLLRLITKEPLESYLLILWTVKNPSSTYVAFGLFRKLD